MENLTDRNYKIIKELTEIAKEYVDGVLLTGSNAWGAYYAVNENSDIDLLMTAKNINQFRKIINVYIAKKILPVNEKERFNIFTELHEQKRADHFSLCVQYKDAVISIDFILSDLISDISNLRPIRSSTCKDSVGIIDIRAINEFRSNPPRVIGYTLDDLKGERMITYHPKFEEVKDTYNSIVGYISETLVDGQAVVNGKNTYLLGVISFYLSINPIILWGKDGSLAKEIKKLQSNIAEILQNQIPQYITRQERMSVDCLKKVKEALSS